MNAEYEVVIVGAGSAGIGAGRVLRDRNARFCVLESKSRTGGRAWTDSQTFNGIPFDRGCHWLHHASQNPLREFADTLGAVYDSTFSFHNTPVLTNGPRIVADESASARRLIEAGLDLVDQAGGRGLDVAAADAVETLAWGRWYPVFEHIVGLITSALPEDVSTLDYARGEDSEEDYPVRDGLGALVCRLGEGLPVCFGTRVSGIDWSSAILKIDTEKGTVRARRAIVTVSTSVLEAGHIRFTPPLPASTSTAVTNCTLGCCEKVAFLLDRPVGMEDAIGYRVVARPFSEASLPVSLFIEPFGRPIIVADLAGGYMSEVLADGEPGLIDVATAAMVDVFGQDVRRSIRKVTASRWTADTDVLGAYSHASPGHASDRLALAQPIGDRIFLAGEAVSIEAFATCHGAYQSGVAAADAALA